MTLTSGVVGAAESLQPPPSHHRKALVQHMLAQPNASAAASIVSAGGARLADYDSFTLFSFPSTFTTAIATAATKLGLRLTLHDEFDTMHLPGGILTKDGDLPADPAGLGTAPAYGSGYGLYVLQFIGPVRSEWSLAVPAAGGIPVQAFNYNGAVIAATPAIAATLARYSFVQLVLPYHPLLKSFPRTLRDGHAPLLVRIANAPGSVATRTRVRALISTNDQSDTYGDHTNVVGVFTAAAAKQIIREPLVFGVGFLAHDSISDERVAQSLTTNVATVNGSRVPTQPAGYTSWLATKCSYCGSLSTDGTHGFNVGIADTGLDAGTNSQHADFGARATFGTDFVPRRPACAPETDRAGQNNGTCCGPLTTEGCDVSSVCEFCDYWFHGTDVAGHAVGNTTDATRVDENGFYLGTGAAPNAGLVITRAANSSGLFATSANVFNWAADAIAHYAYIQNHSHNEYLVVVNNTLESAAVGGQYTQESHEFDLAVRGLNESGPAGNPITPITLVASAGNVNQDSGAGMGWVLAPGTAKNAITAGAAESVRSPTEAHDECLTMPLPRHTTFRNTWLYTKHGTKVTSPADCTVSLTTSCAWDSYIKPEVTVPATQVTAPRSTLASLSDCLHYSNPGNPNFDLYAMTSGTSFAAPIAAGAALIASRVYAGSLGGSPDPTAARPSLLKAMLVASTRSMRGGTNYSVFPWNDSTSTTIGAAPNDVQGFGQLNIDDIVSATPARQYVNETYTFSSAGQKKSWTFPVDDPSKAVKIALAWSDAASPAYVDQTEPAATLLLNDLDLLVDTGDGATCEQYYGNNFTVYDLNPDLDASRGEESIPYGCDQGHADTKNPAEKIVFFPSLANVSRFTVTVVARALTARADPTLPTINQDFSLFVYNAGTPVTIPAPTNLSVTLNGTSATLSWTGVQGAAWFEVWRNGTRLQDSLTSTTFLDNSLSTNAFYVYTVRAIDRSGTNASPFSSAALASTYAAYTDDPLQPQVTTIKSVHITELRTLINALRTAAALGTYTFTTSAQPGDPITASAIGELRNALDPARATLSLPGLAYTDPSMVAGTIIKAVHIQELRNGTLH